MNNYSRPPARRPDTADPLLFSLVRTAEAVQARLEAALDPLGLSLAKVAVLAHLAEAGEPLALRALAERASCVRSNITQLMDRLEKDGLVRRRPDPVDRRGVRAALTPAGKRAHARAQRVLAAEQRVIVGALGAGDAARLESVLRRLAR
ncbi:MAG TPA: MarR family transcriptional regulator [Gemmatimonadales bacterium]|jgi:DNA-binding MarR family transcriptional regulator|nr:MarR family transcriptional regulator [Gemmatimonadales bacterium]